MNLNKKATSIVEAMVVMMIITSWIVWMYKIHDESLNLSVSINNKIHAIQMAKQWIEAATNIRDTNWLIFPSDYVNCWNTLNYDPGCIWNSSPDDIGDGSYKIYQTLNNRWEIVEIIEAWGYETLAYRNAYKVGLKDWIYTQSGITDSITPLFTREIKFNYIDPDRITITSLVQRADSSSTKPHKVELVQILTNWKK